MSELRIGQLAGAQVSSAAGPVGAPPRPQEPAAASFADTLAEALGGLRLSAHAKARMQDDGRSLTRGQTEQLAAAVDRLAAKGGRQGLVLLGDTAFVVSVPNRTVITAVHGERMQQGVFTQIDSAVIVPEEKRGPVLAEGAPGLLNDRGNPLFTHSKGGANV